MDSLIDNVLSFFRDSISSLFDWFLDFFSDFFSGRSFQSVGSSILKIFLNGQFDFSLKYVFETLFGIAFFIFALKILVILIRG